jgi:Mg-chelatase subunit ChlD
MKKAMLVGIIASMFLGGVRSSAAPVQATASAPRIEVVFALDATSSMSGLIAGAKQKIWTIAHQIVSGRPTPAIKLGLVGYRDRGDEYITRVFDLSDDLDDVYGHLMQFQAVGGGDMPESVNQGLYEAVTKISWSKDANVLRVIFLVGDAPPHMDYPDDVKYTETVKLASKAGIIINTIQCGDIAQTTPFWQEVAKSAGGEYVQIDQNGAMRIMSTPVDGDLARISNELSRTVVPYGDAAKQAEVNSKMALAGRASADRVLYLNVDRAEFGAKVVVTGEGELIWDVVNHKVKLEDIKESDLPVQMKSMTPDQRQTFITEQFEKRKQLQIQVDQLATQRDNYIKGELQKLAAQGNLDSFDAKVAAMIQAQASRAGIKYEITAPAPARR